MTRDEAIKQFADTADLTAKVQTAVNGMLARSPRAVMLVWEEESGLYVSTIPFSEMLAKGMADTLYELLCVDGPLGLEDDDED